MLRVPGLIPVKIPVRAHVYAVHSKIDVRREWPSAINDDSQVGHYVGMVDWADGRGQPAFAPYRPSGT